MNFIKDMTPESLVVAGIMGLFFVFMLGFAVRKIMKHKRPTEFRQQWLQLQKKLPNKSMWGEAIIEADKLLEEALKKQKVKGKTVGEMLVNAEKVFTDKDEVWFGHKLRKKIESDETFKLDKKAVKRGLLGLRQGIKDLGAFGGKKK